MAINRRSTTPQARTTTGAGWVMQEGKACLDPTLDWLAIGKM